MPELPEVETTLRGIAPHIDHKTVATVTVREARLRQMVRTDLSEVLHHQSLGKVRRRAKYLILPFPAGLLLIHLGMSGSLRIVLPRECDCSPEKHDHVDIAFTDGTILRYRDPRRFGLIEWFAGAEEFCPRLKTLAVEPLSKSFHTAYLYQALSGRKCPVKTAIMNQGIVVGVGNIYACEALFYVGINPHRNAGSLNQTECARLVKAIKTVLNRAIAAGGSSLRDFAHTDGTHGYFQQHHAVYGRGGKPCLKCGGVIAHSVIGQRSSFYCPYCQKVKKNL